MIVADCFASCIQRSAPSAEVDAGTEAIQQWLQPIRALAVANLRSSSSYAREDNPAKSLRTLVEQNVAAQVSNVAGSSVIQNAWRKGKKVTVHGELVLKLSVIICPKLIPCYSCTSGWVYDISTGKIEDLKVSEGSEVDAQ